MDRHHHISITLRNPEVLAAVQPLFCCLLASLAHSNNNNNNNNNNNYINKNEIILFLCCCDVLQQFTHEQLLSNVIE